MIVEGTEVFPAPRQVVYDLLQDPDVLVKALPGAKSLTRTGDGRFEGVMSVGVGPVTAAEFSIKVELFDQAPPDRFSMRIDGKGAVGFARGMATISLTDGDAGGAVMHYRADLQIGGKIASVGQRLLDGASRTMTRQGLDALSRELESRLGVASPVVGASSGSMRKYVAAGVAIGALLLIGFCRALS
jgi:carbon monoxide dehydrogenase subunit G